MPCDVANAMCYWSSGDKKGLIQKIPIACAVTSAIAKCNDKSCSCSHAIKSTNSIKGVSASVASVGWTINFESALSCCKKLSKLLVWRHCVKWIHFSHRSFIGSHPYTKFVLMLDFFSLPLSTQLLLFVPLFQNAEGKTESKEPWELWNIGTPKIWTKELEKS